MPTMRIDPPWDQRLARRAARWLAAVGITPNGVTSASLIGGLGAAWLYAQGGRAAELGGLLVMLSFWLDHVDGELARATGRASAFGQHYDLLTSGAILVALPVGIGLGLGDAALAGLAVPLGVVAGAAIAVILTLGVDLERRHGDELPTPSWLGFEIEDVMYLVGPITWLGGLEIFLALAGVGAPLYALWALGQRRSVLRRARASS